MCIRDSDYVVLIGGSGPLMCDLQAEIETWGVEDRVKLLGRIPDGDLPAYYGAVSYTHLDVYKRQRLPCPKFYPDIGRARETVFLLISLYGMFVNSFLWL